MASCLSGPSVKLPGFIVISWRSGWLGILVPYVSIATVFRSWHCVQGLFCLNEIPNLRKKEQTLIPRWKDAFLRFFCVFGVTPWNGVTFQVFIFIFMISCWRDAFLTFFWKYAEGSPVFWHCFLDSCSAITPNYPAQFSGLLGSARIVRSGTFFWTSNPLE